MEEQRALFELVSDSMLAAVERFGTAEKVYVQYCPMAFDDKGASWLSMESKIQNPYFGSKMMTCGEVTREFLVR
ncbi:hypothetical protein A3SI_03258 [Nitritalea halalkaliphila LW7]|uniref:DUF3347 domain-containing protein n=1 Tax=Nitritalea halalkaliphila LW7 TaxID=1189621 RepID=I5C9L3_9BACT|nr:hypothetical protein A3SI_03258 [Nitritalea halalkaliphila LW7]